MYWFEFLKKTPNGIFLNTIELSIQYKLNPLCFFSVKVSLYYLSFTLQPHK